MFVYTMLPFFIVFFLSLTAVSSQNPLSDGSPIDPTSYYALQTVSMPEDKLVIGLTAHYFEYAIYGPIEVRNGTERTSLLQYIPTREDDDAAFRYIVSEYGTYLTGSIWPREGERISFRDRYYSPRAREYQKWRLVHRGEGAFEIINKVTYFSLGFYYDDNPVLRQPIWVACYNTSNMYTRFRFHQLDREPVNAIALNKNTYHVDQEKSVCYVTPREESEPDMQYMVSGPEMWIGNLTRYADFFGNAYYCDALSDIRTQGSYTIKTEYNDEVTELFISDTAFESIRHEMGGAMTLETVMDGHIELNTVKEPEVLFTGRQIFEGVVEIFPETYTMSGGMYDGVYGSSVQSISVDNYEFMAALLLSVTNPEQQALLRAQLKSGTDWYLDTQGADGSWMIGKRMFNVSLSYWEIGVEPCAVAKIGSALVAISEAFADDQAYADRLINAGIAALRYVEDTVSDVEEVFIMADERRGTYYDVITLASELYIATKNTIYKDKVDARINEAIVDEIGAYRHRDGPDHHWPYKRIAGYSLTDFSTFWYSMARYYLAISDPIIKAKLDTHIEKLMEVWHYQDYSPFNFPTHQLLPYSETGWGGSAVVATATLLKMYEATHNVTLLNYATNMYDYIFGANAFGSNLFVGGRGVNKAPLSELPWKKATGAVLPGASLIFDESLNRFFRMSDLYIPGFSYADSRYTMTFLYVLDILAAYFPANTFSDHIPEPLSKRIFLPDQFLDKPFEYDLKPFIFDFDEDPLRCVKGMRALAEIENHLWWNITCDCILTGTALKEQNETWHNLNIQVDDGILAPQVFNVSFYVFPEDFNLFVLP